jgi:methylenetetrahydrofolate dehydrogenase (NADP+)/methenyltetrahydrofolate cyclohydrolase
MHAPAQAQLMDGTALSHELVAETTQKARSFLTDVGRRPCLAAILVGEDPASVTYVRMKRARCQRVGIEPRLIALPATASTAEAVEAVDAASLLTPVPGGVGPMTIAVLLNQTIVAAQSHVGSGD